MFFEHYVSRNLGQSLSFYEARTGVAEEAFISVSEFFVEEYADDAVKNRISEVFEIFVVGLSVFFFFR
jgi:hypothetical protein